MLFLYMIVFLLRYGLLSRLLLSLNNNNNSNNNNNNNNDNNSNNDNNYNLNVYFKGAIFGEP